MTANGTKIFEGDIVKDSYGDSYVVKYGRHDLSCCGCCFKSHDSMGFYLCSSKGYALSDEDAWDNLELIGNIHDNPELLNPSLKPEYHDGDPDCPICPNCRTPLSEMEDCDCGQKIDWSEE